MNDGRQQPSDEQLIEDARAGGLYDNELFKIVRADAGRYQQATEMAVAALKVIQNIAMDGTSQKIALRVRLAMERAIEEGEHRG